MRIALALLLSSAFAGCSTYQSIPELKPAPLERILVKATQPDAATITLLRSKEFAGSAVPMRVLVNGQHVASIEWSEWLSIPVAPGDVILEVRHPFTLMGVSGDSVAFNAVPQGRYYFRIVYGSDGPRLLRATEASANGQ